MSLVSAISYLLTTVGAISGIKSAPSSPPESMNSFPFLICYPDSGEYSMEFAGEDKGLHKINLELYFNRSNLPSAVTLMTPFIKLIKDAIKSDMTFGGSVDTVVASNNSKISYSVLSVEYADIECLVLQFSITVKVKEI